jgi:hypothetical protein
MGAVATLKMLLKRLLQHPADALLASSTRLPNEIWESLTHHPLGLSGVVGKFLPYKPDQNFYIILKSKDQG